MKSMRGNAIVTLVALGLGACSFKPGSVPADGGPDGPPPITAGFAKTTTLADEASNVVSIRVVLSAPSDEAVTVAYAINGGTATLTSDYTATAGSLTFAPGDVEELVEVTVVADGIEESDETVDLELTSVTGNNVVLANALHTLTIAANVLPRVSFTTTSTMSSENTSATIDVMLSAAPAVATSVDLVVSGTSTATGGGVDYDLSATTVTFAVGETTKQISLTVNNDTLDENDENAILTLDNPMSVILAATNTTRTHVIQDNDLPPTVSFAAGPTSSIAEAGTMVDLTVSLSTASGKDITVDFAVDGGSSATATDDFSIGTTSPLSFPAGTTTKTIRVNVVQDTVVEVGETVVLTLGPLDTTIVTAGADITHALTITDDDGTCLGTGAYTACFAMVNGTKNLSGTFNTDTDSNCTTPAAGWTGQPVSCFVAAATINVNGALNVTGSKPLVLLSSGNISVTANLDASSHRGGTSGPGANSPSCTAYTDAPTVGNTGAQTGAGGGAGGSFRSAGGDGGNGGVNTGNSGGSSTAAVGAPTVLRGGCAGQAGGTYNGAGAGAAGAGGGAVYLIASGTLTINSGIAINVSGAAATAAGPRGGGGGAGSGGMIKLVAGTFSVNGARLMANGGGGSKGGDGNDSGADGSDPSMATPTTVAAGGTAGNGGGDGGNGFAGSTQATDGGNDSGDNAGGGGGGGGGHIEASAALTGATVSPGP
jgi:hypothetical protein